MNYLVDTNVISELRKPNCNPNVATFVSKIPRDKLFISAVSIGEIAYGIYKLADAERRSELLFWLNEGIIGWFRGRTVNLDTEIMIEWGNMCARHGKSLSIIDSLIAATALSHHFTVVTRNVKDFENIKNLSVVNPWQIVANA
ncbi:type II toxin-antitoxin system VapC family toxin [Deferribacterales bacterium RsTz2092]